MPDKLEQLKKMGFENLGAVHWNLPTTALIEEAIKRREGLLAHLGPLVVRTGQYTGRSPNDKYLVDEPESAEKIWWGDVNQAISPEKYDRLRNRALAYLQGRDLYIQEVYSGADQDHSIGVRVISESAWHTLFARTMFILEKDGGALENFSADYTIIHVPYFRAIPEYDSTRSEVFVSIHFGRKEILIGGTAYAGEIKKSVFTVMNYLLPLNGVLSMHCSANYGKDPDDVALFFGLSGTGKTTLSIEARRTLVGDDEHGWSDQGIFNFEGGCYAKMIRISEDTEPEIYQTTRQFGTILENVAIDPQTRRLDLNDDSLTQNTRGAFPISLLDNATRNGVGGHPKVIFFLTADAFGVLPPIAKLTPAQARYYFLLGYTAKVAGTERGITEPQATFSPCFGAPFMVHSPEVYAKLLGQKIEEHNVQVWLVNTGWTGGPFGVGRRINLPYTRSMVHAVQDGDLDDVELETEPYFSLQVPKSVPGVPEDVLHPQVTWGDKSAYEQKAKELAQKFNAAFAQFSEGVSEEVRSAGPEVG